MCQFIIGGSSGIALGGGGTVTDDVYEGVRMLSVRIFGG